MEDGKFVCKYCGKRFSCGKSLGGHIRTHMMDEQYSYSLQVQSNEERNNNNNNNGHGNTLIYALRENQKKTTRFCKECGKGFPSLKALCGHMACHKEKDKVGINKLVIDSQSDSENSGPRRSNRMKRFKNLRCSNNNNSNNLSSCVSEVEQEQEEVARCLMLLSKDSGYLNKDRFVLVTESSDNNSEAKSPSPINYAKSNNAYKPVEKKKKKLNKDVLKLKITKRSDIDYDSHNSDSGYFLYGPKKEDSDDDVSSDRFFLNEANSSKVGHLSSFKDHGFETRKMLSIERSRNTIEFKNHDDDFDSRKRPNYDSVDQDLVECSNRKIGNGLSNGKIYEEHGGKGGCLRSERDNVVSDYSTYESDENSTDSNSYPATTKTHNNNGKIKKFSKGKKKLKSKKSREHECLICNKIFRSGQALGGHKRSHFIGGSEENTTLVLRPGARATPPAAGPCLIDFNLPAPVDD